MAADAAVFAAGVDAERNISKVYPYNNINFEKKYGVYFNKKISKSKKY